jgi:hypothetical protein
LPFPSKTTTISSCARHCIIPEKVLPSSTVKRREVPDDGQKVSYARSGEVSIVVIVAAGMEGAQEHRGAAAAIATVLARFWKFIVSFPQRYASRMGGSEWIGEVP